MWEVPRRGSYAFRYALLDQRGHVGPVTRIATLHGYITDQHFAVNDRGELALAWIQGTGNPVGMLVLCSSRGHCARPRALHVPRTPAGAFLFDAVSLADDGTATDLIGGHGIGQPPPWFGVWALVTHVGRNDGHLAKLAPAGEFPVAVSSGRSGAVAMFSPTPETLSWTFLLRGRSHFTKPRPVSDDLTTEQPLLAANLEGQYVAAWAHITSNIDGSYIQTAATGAGAHPGPPTTVTQLGSPLAGGTTAVAIDGHGNAIMIWDRGTSHGTVGLFDATTRVSASKR